MPTSRVLSKIVALFGVALAALVLLAGPVAAQDYDGYDGYDSYDICDLYDGYDGYDPPAGCEVTPPPTTTPPTTAPPTVQDPGGVGLPNTGGVAMAGLAVVLAGGALALRRLSNAV